MEHKQHKKKILDNKININTLLYEYFNLRMLHTKKQLKQTHLLKIVRKNIARIKSKISE